MYIPGQRYHSLPPKWLLSRNHDPTPNSGDQGDLNTQLSHDTHFFDPKLRLMMNLEDTFHIIKPKVAWNPIPVQPDTHYADPPHILEDIDVFCGAASRINNNGEYISGGSTWFRLGNDHNISFQPTPTNQTSKDSGILGALLLALQRTNLLDNLTVHMYDQNIIQNLTTRLDLNENLNWFHLQDKNLHRALVMKLKL
ncbi:hypothetical protein V8B97DRAFT_1916004 [Scleroderma yunnanense]